MAKIISKEKDMAGKWRALVEDDAGECVFLKFHKEPGDAEIIEEFNKKPKRDLKKELSRQVDEINLQIDNLQSQKAEVKKQIDGITHS